MSFLRTSIRRLIHPITIAFTLLIVVGIALSSLVGAQRTDHELVQHTMEVKEALTSTQLTVYEAETGMRGFLITGRDDYLQPYLNARDILPLHVGNIEKLVADNPRQQNSVTYLKPVVEELLATL